MDFTTKRFTLWVHIIFWVCYLLLSTGFYINLDGFNITLKILVTALLHALLTYVNLLVLIPKLFFKRKFALYFLFYVPLFVGVIFSIASYEAFYVDKTMIGFNQIFTATISSSVTVTMLAMLKFLQEWYKQQEKARLLAFNQLQAEHKMLRMQVNPHFLFNALNNIYYLAHKKSADTAPAILKLSDLMRFLLYESEERKIPIQKEIDYIENYIGLMKLKYADNCENIKLKVQGLTDIKIEPLLMIPFVENAFKHGNLENQDGFMDIQIETTDEWFSFKIKNSFDVTNTRKDSVGGVGIENVTNRLKAYYPNTYSLTIDQSNSIYTVNLIIYTL